VKQSLCLLLWLLLAGSVIAGENPWADYRFAQDALMEIDLASDAAWTLSVDDGPARPIKVTAGGWNSDQQEPQIPTAAVKDHVVYEREVAIPAEAKDRVVKVVFGGCNYGAEVLLDGRKIAQHHAPMTPFKADLTGVAEPGKTHVLRVKAYHRWHYGKPPIVTAGFDFSQGVSKQYEGHTKYPYGLTGHVRLAVFPLVYISDAFVRPSVRGKALAYDAWVSNGGTQARSVVLKGKLAPWGGKTWPYPELPPRTVRVAGGMTQKITLDGIPWGLGPESYWWPNVPFREDYAATLHWLELSLEEDGKPVHQRRQRFGFAEHAERPFYYTVNGVRVNSFGDSNSYGQVGEYDCWTETACFQPPRGERRGCPETWKRYQRVGFNSMRLSTSVPTRYMLETADEAGYTLIPEGGSWGNGTCAFHKENFSAQLQALIRVCRNHPCVARYSMANESIHQNPDRDNCLWRWLIDAALEVDPTRPYVFEVNPGAGTGPIRGMKGGHAYRMQHYDPIVQGGDHIRGMGECAWTTDGMNEFAMMAVKMRLNDYAHFAPWSWVNFWPNFLEGMSHARHPWKTNNYPDRRDGADGWGSPIVKSVQWALHPYLVVDRGLVESNPAIRENSAAGKVAWPYRVPAFAAGTKIERKIEVFNGALTSGTMELRWAARWDSPEGPEVARGVVGPFSIEAGSHATQTLALEAPKPGRDERMLYLALESARDGQVVFRDGRAHFAVTARPIRAAEAVFLGADEATQGDWQGKYGEDGSWLAGREAKLPAYAKLDLADAPQWVWKPATNEPRALAYSVGQPPAGSRVAACWYGSPLAFDLDVGDVPHKVTLYVLDWDQKNVRQQRVEIRRLDGEVLDRRDVGKFQAGRYLTWRLRGRVQVEVQRISGTNAVISGVFFGGPD